MRKTLSKTTIKIEDLFKVYNNAEIAEAKAEPNPLNITPYGNCPVQAEGQLSKKEHYYFRARHQHWSLTIAPTRKDTVGGTDKVLFYAHGKWGKEEHDAGWIRKAIAIRLATLAIQLYLVSKSSIVKS